MSVLTELTLKYIFKKTFPVKSNQILLCTWLQASCPYLRIRAGSRDSSHQHQQTSCEHEHQELQRGTQRLLIWYLQYVELLKLLYPDHFHKHVEASKSHFRNKSLKWHCYIIIIYGFIRKKNKTVLISWTVLTLIESSNYFSQQLILEHLELNGFI